LTQSDNQVRAEIAAALGDFKGDEGASSTETKLLQSDTSYETPAARDSSLRLWLSECLLLAGFCLRRCKQPAADCPWTPISGGRT
jgi:hypothetical protein